MKKIKKQMIVAGAAIMLAGTMLAGCGSKDAANKSEESDVVQQKPEREDIEKLNQLEGVLIAFSGGEIELEHWCMFP